MAFSRKKYLTAHSYVLFLGIAILTIPASLNQQADSYDYAVLIESEKVTSNVEVGSDSLYDKRTIKNRLAVPKKLAPEVTTKPKLNKPSEVKSNQYVKSSELRLPETAKVMNSEIKRRVPREKYNTIKSRSRGIFNTLELEFDDSQKIRSWASVMPIVLQDRRSFKSCINHENSCGFDTLSQWARDLRHLKGQPLNVIVRQVNMRVNSLNYQSDAARYGEADKWLAPRDFLQMGGDCEDFALLKMASLSALGVSEDNMRIVVGTLDDGRAHAVLNVNIRGEDTILDNRKSGILLAQTRDFKPKYSMNFKKRWTHIERKPTLLYAHNIVK